jgi:predicted ester cyclase
MSIEQNKATMRRTMEDVINKGDLGLIPQLIAADYVYRNPMGIEYRGPDGFRQFVTEMRGALPDIKITVDEAVGEGETLAVRMTMRGTFKGKLGPIEPTGKRLDMPMAYFYRYRDSKETAALPFIDMLTFYKQLGIKAPGP